MPSSDASAAIRRSASSYAASFAKVAAGWRAPSQLARRAMPARLAGRPALTHFAADGVAPQREDDRGSFDAGDVEAETVFAGGLAFDREVVDVVPTGPAHGRARVGRTDRRDRL